MAQYTDFGFMRPEGNGGDDQMYSKELATFKTYLQHPSYKKRLGKEMFGNNPIDLKAVEDEYNRRLKALEETKYLSNSKYKAHGIEGMYDPIKGTIQASNPESFYHEMTHRLDPLAQSEEAKIDKSPEFVKIKDSIVKYPDTIIKPYDEKYTKNFLTWSNSIKNKLIQDAEQGKIVPRNKEYYKNTLNYYANKETIPDRLSLYKLDAPLEEFQYPEGYKNELYNTPEGKKILEAEENSKPVISLKYLNTPTEIKGRINSLRIQAMDKFKYDPSKPFNIQNYPELKKDTQYQELRKNLKMSDEDINELSKYIAQVPFGNRMRQAQYQALRNMA